MSPSKLTGTVILVAGVTMIIAGVVVAAAFDPLVGGVLVIVGISDLVVGSLFRSGRLGTAPESDAAFDQAAADAAAEREANAAALGTTADGEAITGDENPYARED